MSRSIDVRSRVMPSRLFFVIFCFLLFGCVAPSTDQLAGSDESTSDSFAPNMKCEVTETVRAEPPQDPAASPFGDGPWYINEDRTIWAGWDASRMVAGDSGNKVLWIRPQGAEFTISGERIDDQALPLRAEIPCCYPTGFQATGLYFPEAGCWKISATAGNSSLTFVTIVR